MTYAWHDFVGNIGVIFILGTYAALMLERIDPKRALYALLNGMGAVLILVSLCYDFNLSSALIEMAWLLISVFGLAKALKAA